MAVNDERLYLRRRARDELAMTIRAASIEAKHSHNLLTGYYIEACKACAHGRTGECVDCTLQMLCNPDTA